MAEEPTTRHISYFKNQGSGGGASLLHPHAQLVALPIVPETVQRGQERAFGWFQEHGRSVFASSLEEELALRDAAAARQFTNLVVAFAGGAATAEPALSVRAAW